MYSGQRGDTIIEVIFAVTVFSLVAVGGITIMNQGAATAQRSLEIGLAREQIDSQADALRYIHSAYAANGATDANSPWKKITAMAYSEGDSNVQSISDVTSGTSCEIGSDNGSAQPFAIDASQLDTKDSTKYLLTGHTPNGYDTTSTPGTSLYGSPATYAKLRYPATDGVAWTIADGLWVQAVKSSPGATVGYYDFHIFACWSSPGQSVPSTLGTIVRLYDA